MTSARPHRAVPGQVGALQADPKIEHVEVPVESTPISNTTPLSLSPSSISRLPTLRALVADDDPVSRAAVKRILLKHGYEVATADDGEEAWVRATTVDFDVLFTDLDMPRLGGAELMRSLKESRPDLPIVFITGNPSVGTAVEAMNSGVVAYIEKPFESEQVIAAADKALALKKRTPPEVPLDLEATRLFDSALAGLHIHYQPIVSWSGRAPFSYEALLRTTFKEVPHPGVFLDLAEGLGRVKDLGRLVRAAAAKELSENPNAPEVVFVNLHPEELLDEELYDPGKPLSRIAERVFLEITERESLRETLDVHERIKTLKELGFRIAIDDIGAGYSGLNSFVDLDPHLVKIDMGLVRGIDTCSRRQKLVRSLFDLAIDLGIQVVAEGVETPAERDCLLGLKCDLFQGYLFSKPSEPFPLPIFPEWGER